MISSLLKLKPAFVRPALLAFSAVMLMSCASANKEGRPSAAAAQEDEKDEDKPDEDSFDARLAKLKLGMSKQQVITIMGEDGVHGPKSQSAMGTLESISYQPNFGHRYATALMRAYTLGNAGANRTDGAHLQFKDGKLTSINQF